MSISSKTPSSLLRSSANSVYTLLALISFCFPQRIAALDLIQNGSFEADPDDFGPLRTDWDDGAGINNDIGFAVREYGVVLLGELEHGGEYELPPGADDSGFSGRVAPADAGRFFGDVWGVWNGNGQRGSATQIVDLTGHAGKPYNFSAWLASHHSDTDYATLTIEFFDELNASGQSLGATVFNGDDQTSPFIVGSLTLRGVADPLIPATQDNWTLYRAAGTIPSLAESAAVVIHGEGITGGGNNGFVDLVSLQVIPEPSSAVLACLLGGIAAAWCGRRNICWS